MGCRVPNIHLGQIDLPEFASKADAISDKMATTSQIHHDLLEYLWIFVLAAILAARELVSKKRRNDI